MASTRCTLAAPVFDPLSARIADMSGWDVVKLSGSVGKYANLALPDDVPMSNMSDLVDVVRRITRVCDAPLIVDADDGGSVLAIRRVVPELEAAGAAAIEIEDNLVPSTVGVDRHSLMMPVGEYVARLRAAVAARRVPSTVIVARTAALWSEPVGDVVERIVQYARCGVDALMIPGVSKGLSPNPRSDIEAVQRVSGLPLFLSNMPRELRDDEKWMTDNRVRLRFTDQAPFRMAVKGISDALTYLRENGDGIGLEGASAETIKRLIRSSEVAEWTATYG